MCRLGWMCVRGNGAQAGKGGLENPVRTWLGSLDAGQVVCSMGSWRKAPRDSLGIKLKVYAWSDEAVEFNVAEAFGQVSETYSQAGQRATDEWWWVGRKKGGEIGFVFGVAPRGGWAGQAVAGEAPGPGH